MEDLCAKHDFVTTDYIPNTTATSLPLTEVTNHNVDPITHVINGNGD